MSANVIEFRPGEPVSRRALPVLPERDFREEALRRAHAGQRWVDFFGMPDKRGVRLVAILADDATGRLAASAMEPGEAYAALTPECLAVHLFEREIFESRGVLPKGHPALAPVRYPMHPMCATTALSDADRSAPGTGVLYRVEGEGIHEVAVGPVMRASSSQATFDFSVWAKKCST